VLNLLLQQVWRGNLECGHHPTTANTADVRHRLWRAGWWPVADHGGHATSASALMRITRCTTAWGEGMRIALQTGNAHVQKAMNRRHATRSQAAVIDQLTGVLVTKYSGADDIPACAIFF
jgi:hypothetical protein